MHYIFGKFRGAAGIVSIGPFMALVLLLAAHTGGSLAHALSIDTRATRVPLVVVDDDSLNKAFERITDFATQLEPRLWTGKELDSTVRKQANTLASAIVARIDVNGIAVDDIVIVGSVASYEYDSHSDFDIHIFLNMDGYSGDIGVFNKYIVEFNQANKHRYSGITFHGYPVEVLIYTGKPSSQMSPGAGMYSVKSGIWLVEPEQSLPHFTKDQILEDARKYISQYNRLVTEFNANPDGFDCSRLQALATGMRSYRRAGIESHGIRSTPNLTYRMLRRLDTNLPEALRSATDACVSRSYSLH